ncbi:flavodoxin domain-containing protein [Clostridium thermopalmarium]|uniref:Flavodoxin n=2 Tax=Clostridium TaxID=1485 RepID=A0A2T0AKT8_9CLOT|nr:flavodoxin domain-containing protein [Clostridium thermopalmarium]PRR69133.1 flavodoxin [Clostridium thermopalmarium DSM 5974]PVZ26516.1 flavodoxin [Clostridium thermopalmarium DSM 5974]
MKSLIIYFSTYKNNTEKIAKVFANKINADLISLKNLENIEEIETDNYDLIGFGSGVYKESLSPQLFKCIEELNLKDKNVFVFSTSGIGMKFYNNKAVKLLVSKGAINKGSFACKGSFVAHEFSKNKIFDIMGRLSKGHPNYKDIRNAEEFIEKVVLQLSRD